MTGAPLVAGVDVATAEVRAVCATPDGRIVTTGHAALPAPDRPAPGRSEQDARAWWPAMVAALGEALRGLGPRRADVVALSICSTSGTVVLVDARGEPAGPALMYDDRRAVAEAELAAAAGQARWDALALRISPSFALPKLGWLVAHDRAAAGRAARACGTADLLAWRLTGEPPPADWSHALKTGFDVLRGEWPLDVLERLEIPPGWLPPVGAPATPAGRVSAEAAAATGLPEGCEVRLGMTDGCGAQLAVGAARPGRAVSVLGTTLVLKAASRALLHDPTGAVYSHRHPCGWWLPGGASNSGAQPLRVMFAGADLAALDRAALDHGPARHVRYPLLGMGERFPFLEPDAEGFTLGEPAGGVDRFRGVLEGVAYVEALCVAHLEALGLDPVTELRLAGGASRSEVWNRIRATVLDRPVVVTRSPSTAFGACILAAAGTVHADLEAAADAMVRVAHRVDPVPEERAALSDGLGRLEQELSRRGWWSRRHTVPAAS